MSRATNNQGETQPLEFPNKWDGRSYGNNMGVPSPGRGARHIGALSAEMKWLG